MLANRSINRRVWLSVDRIDNRLLGFGSNALMRLPFGRRPPVPQNILVVRLGNLGDIIVAIPAFRAIRAIYPHARITLLTSPTKRGAPCAEEILAGDPTFDEIIVYYADESGSIAFLKQLRRRIAALDTDLAVILPDDLSNFKSLAKYLALLAVSGVRRVVGAEVVGPGDAETSQVDRLMGLIKPLGPVSVAPVPWLTASRDNRAYAENALAAAAGRTLVGLQCGAKRPANRWPADRFIALGRSLVEEDNVCLVLTGSEQERNLTSSIAAAIGGNCINLAGRTTLGQLACVAAACRVFVSNDTGTMHVAAAMGTPVVAIFGGRDRPYRWYPYGDRHVVLRKDIECSPCFQDVCPLFESPECLNRVGVTEVLEATRNMLRIDEHAITGA